jgi:hypothetical protein
MTKRYVNIMMKDVKPYYVRENLEVFSNTFTKGVRFSGCSLYASFVEETKIIQEDTHLLQQVQTFGRHGIGGVSTS